MRIYLDPGSLAGDALKGEKDLFIHTVLPLLTRGQGVEWIVLPAPGGIGGWIGRRLPKRWQLSRMGKKFGVDLVIGAGEMAGIPGAADERYCPLPEEEKGEIKERYSDGKEYFLACVAGARPEEIVALLKAFSLFKKRQRSNMQLVLGGNKRPARLASDLAHYKYRSDVHMQDDPGEEEWRKLVAASYALVLSFGKSVHGLALLNAWKAETPVILPVAVPLKEVGKKKKRRETRCESILQDIGEDAVLYSQPGDPASLAALLMSLYTNEGLRADLVGKGRDRLRSFNWERSAARVWEGILRVSNNKQ